MAQLMSVVVMQLCMALQPLPAMAQDVIIQEGERGSEMYIIVSGEVVSFLIKLSRNIQSNGNQLNMLRFETLREGSCMPHVRENRESGRYLHN